METRRMILANAVIDAWRKGEPYGLLLSALYRDCGATMDQAIAWVDELKNEQV